MKKTGEKGRSVAAPLDGASCPVAGSMTCWESFWFLSLHHSPQPCELDPWEESVAQS